MKKPASQWYVYMLCCSDGSWYTGITTDPERRLRQHNGGSRGARYTRSRRPVRLVYQEACADRSSALRREYAIKQLPARAKRALAAASDSV
ncbi:MAG TPA: GIY-YIG nuclease family protein [Gammaproteobacteria bacterium]|nr:GIY-YIG nuclease family protein [Gammaproteobacteria bacterium]